MAQPESRLSRAIMAHLRANGIWCMKIHGGPTMMAGVPDILACVPVCFHNPEDDPPMEVGLFVGFETKMPGGGHPTPVQVHVHERIRVAAGRVFVVRSIQDVVAGLQSVGWTPDRLMPPAPSTDV
jgi:hypothetical protein